ncbi:sensor domain-containing protein [Magnetospirillum molischianum]|uniref:Predicted signal transduction protein containing a membrane domain n=1 Tax=Magnetospirillum molischianum DSM 120 TaxID=1150626 RepID=H8FW91_MAGML|nr:EAL domain-containing protein [Magnetospirillum molischianum]CCG42629.1 Predicted signal transduction protein containing a membrane domain [Magnetospirillum molischianum DSM 120]
MSDRLEASAATVPTGSLEEAQIRLKGLVACIPGIAFIRRLSPNGTINYPWFSDGVRAILGFSPQTMGVNAKGCLHVIHWADRDQHVDAMHRSAQTMEPCRDEYRAITAAGEVRWMRGQSIPHRGEDGGVEWNGLVIDVTDERRAELRLDMLMDHAEDSILILDTQGRIDTANAAAQRLFGRSNDSLIGQPLAALLAPEHRHPELLDSADISSASIVGGGPRDLTGLNQDGTTFALELSTSEVRLDGQRLFVGIGRDVTRRRQTEAALRETEQRLRAIAANMPGIVFQRVLWPDGRLEFTYVSEGCRSVLGISPEDLLAEPDRFLQMLTEDERLAFMTGLGRSARAMEPFDEEISVLGPDRRRRWLRGQSRPTRRASGEVVWDGVIIDVTDRKLAEQRLSFLAYHDPLTRLPNRTAFLERFETARDEARRQSSLLGIVSLGLDRLGVINATMGHDVGDQVLMGVADLIRASIGPSDMMARVSGDHFLLLLTGYDNRRILEDALDRLHAQAQTTVSVGGQDFDVSAATGVALFPRDGEDAETLIKNADAALQRAKGQGTASFQMFTKELSTRATKTLSMQNRLRRAVDNGELSAHYQPQVDLINGGIVGMEALVRWTSPELGPVSPGDFIPVAEESGLIDVICEFMLDTCTRQTRDWQLEGLPSVPVAVNVSGRQFQYARRLIGACERVLSDTGLESHWLELELTETSAMRDADNAIAVVQRLKEMGIGCAIDDFGTGYSSLSVLKRFPIQKLKIDRSFVMDVATDPNDAAIVDAIIAMAKALKLTVVAEGVERQEDLDFLRKLGCDQIQGYIFSRPLPAEAMRDLLVRGHRLGASIQR